MKIINTFCWILVLFGSARANYLSELQQYATADWNAAPGYIGCRFSGVLCSYDEQCIDDGLFGNCQKANGGLIPDFYQYELTTGQRDELESILVALIESGFGWSHAYTQCVIGNVLWSYRNAVPQYDITQCEAVVRSPQEQQRSDYDDVTSDDVIADPDEGNSNDINFTRRGGEGRGRSSDEPGPTVEEFEQFLSGLSDSDLTDLERYVADDLASQQQQTRAVVSDNGDVTGDDKTYAYYITGDTNSPSGGGGDFNNWYESVVDKKDDVADFNRFYNDRYVNRPQEYETKVSVSYDPDGGTDGESLDDDDDDNDDADMVSDADASDGYDGEGRYEEVSDTKNVNKPLANAKPAANVADAAVQRPQASINGAGGGGSSSSSNGQQSKTFSIKPSIANVDNVPSSSRQTSNQYTVTEKVPSRQKYVLTMYVLCGLVGGVTLAAVVLYLVRRRRLLQDKLANWVSTGSSQQPSDAYKDLCRQHMQSKFSEKTEPVHICGPRVEKSSAASLDEKAVAARTGSTGSSTSSWTEEPVTSNLDISTGHIVLAYMEDHLKNKDRLLKEWETLSAYDPEPCSIVAAIEPTNMRKNRFTDILPYEHSRVKLSVESNVSSSDYINASTIMDHDPRNPAYIATQGPLPHTVADFWQMIWEQGCIVIVNLTRLTENGVSVCHRYWPEEGSDLYHIYEVHLVSEHVWCEDYVIRSFYLKNLQTSETRTVTQFHFVAWANNDVPPTPKSLLDFRRKVNKSFRCRSNPIVVHCSDGAGRTGTYCLIDMVLNRLSKGAKEIDIAATLEHIRDQRVNMVRTKEQFEFALTAVAQEVQAILHAPT